MIRARARAMWRKLNAWRFLTWKKKSYAKISQSTVYSSSNLIIQSTYTVKPSISRPPHTRKTVTSELVCYWVISPPPTTS